jgi:hypothetical protein
VPGKPIWGQGKVLFHGKICIGILSGKTQLQFGLIVQIPFYKRKEKKQTNNATKDM